jgi:hypothetical protein
MCCGDFPATTAWILSWTWARPPRREERAATPTQRRIDGGLHGQLQLRPPAGAGSFHAPEEQATSTAVGVLPDISVRRQFC